MGNPRGTEGMRAVLQAKPGACGAAAVPGAAPGPRRLPRSSAALPSVRLRPPR